MNRSAISEILQLQDGVIARRQILACGGSDNDIERWVRRRELTRVFDGVFLNHTGPPTWEQRAWAAVLCHWPAALRGSSALRGHRLRLAGRPAAGGERIEVAVAACRCPKPAPGVAVRRIQAFEENAQLHLGPPRLRLERALLEVASEASDEAGAVAVLADAAQTRRTTPARLLRHLEEMPRLRHRRLLAAILADVATGAYSVLERRHLNRVERAHGLPSGRRQRRVRVGLAACYRDVEYVGLGVIVELDGRLGHEGAGDRWADLDRDLAAAVAGGLTLRVGWKQVLEPCRLALSEARILLARGWDGTPRPCGPTCAVRAVAEALPAPGAGDASAIDG